MRGTYASCRKSHFSMTALAGTCSSKQVYSSIFSLRGGIDAAGVGAFDLLLLWWSDEVLD